MRRVTAFFAIAALITACGVTSASYKDAAEDVIEDDERTADNYEGRTFDDARCEDPANDDPGTTFTCTAIDADGVPVEFSITIDGDDRFTLNPPRDTGTAPTTTAPLGMTTIGATTTVATPTT